MCREPEWGSYLGRVQTEKPSQSRSLNLGLRGKIFANGDVNILDSKASKGTGFVEVHRSRCGWRPSEGVQVVTCLGALGQGGGLK